MNNTNEAPALYSIYWIHLQDHQNPLRDGYIGITKRSPELRFKEHVEGKRVPIDATLTVMLGGLTEMEARYLEFYFRPRWRIGWNTAIGGKYNRRPPGIHTSGWKIDPKYSRGRSERVKGEKNPLYGWIHVTDGVANKMIPPGDAVPDGWRRGRCFSAQTKARMSASAKKRGYIPLSSEVIEKIRRANQKLIWITDGALNARITEADLIPEGWKPGLTKGPHNDGDAARLRTLTSGMIWITNEIDSQMIDPSSVIPSGWRRGRKKFSEETKKKISAARLALNQA